MRYLSSISLALIVHVLLSVVGLMALAACSSTDIGPQRLAPSMDVSGTVVQSVVYPGQGTQETCAKLGGYSSLL